MKDTPSILLYLCLFSFVWSYESPAEYSLAVIDTFLSRAPPPEPTIPQLGRMAANTALFLAADLLNNNTCGIPLLNNTKLKLRAQADYNSPSLAIRKMMALGSSNTSFVMGLSAAQTAIPASIVGSVFDVAVLSYFSPDTPLSNKKEHPYFSRTVIASDEQAKTMHDILLYYSSIQGPGWTDVAVISAITPYTIDFSNAFINFAPEEITILQYRQFLIDEENIDVELEQIKLSGARVIVALLSDGYSDFIAKADASGLVGDNYVWLIPPTAVGLSFLTPVPLARGTIAPLNFFPPTAPYLECFTNAWKTANPIQYPLAGRGAAPSLGTYLAFDAVMIAATALQKLDDQELLDGRYISASTWSETIRSSSFNGIGGLISFKPNGDRIGTTSVLYYNVELNSFQFSAIRSADDGITHVNDIVWFSNTTEIPDLDIHPPFNYWSCEDRKRREDPTGKTISLHTPGGSNVDEIESHYHCDQFLDCQNLSDESVDCGSNYTVLFIVFGIITGLLMLLVVFLIVFVFLFGIVLKYQRLKTASPYFLMIMLFSIFLGYSSIFSFFGKPHPVACAFQPWLLGLSAVSMITALVVKNIRIWRIFHNPLKRTKISDLELLVLWILIFIPALVIVILWTIISTPTAAIEERDGEDHYVCTTGGFTGVPGGIIFFSVLVVYSAIVLVIGAIISILIRKVPSMFNETKLLAISIYNLGFLSIVIIPVFLVIQQTNPFLAWILRTCAVLYAFTATLVLQFATMVFGVIFIDRFHKTAPKQGNVISLSTTISMQGSQ